MATVYFCRDRSHLTSLSLTDLTYVYIYRYVPIGLGEIGTTTARGADQIQSGLSLSLCARSGPPSDLFWVAPVFSYVTYEASSDRTTGFCFTDREFS
jgi:hypothetical protein